jgi:hypothetical protein
MERKQVIKSKFQRAGISEAAPSLARAEEDVVEHEERKGRSPIIEIVEALEYSCVMPFLFLLRFRMRPLLKMWRLNDGASHA